MCSLAGLMNFIPTDDVITSKANPVAPFEPEVKRQAVMALCTRQVSASEIGNNGVTAFHAANAA
ncbi:IS3 family transposase [Escherichia coli]|nr:IS3 family transposase [Escherichia coli]